MTTFAGQLRKEATLQTPPLGSPFFKLDKALKTSASQDSNTAISDTPTPASSNAPPYVYPMSAMHPHPHGYPSYPHYHFQMYPPYAVSNQTPHPSAFYSSLQQHYPAPPHSQVPLPQFSSARHEDWHDALPPSDFDFEQYASEMKLSLHERACLEEMGFAGEKLAYISKETAAKAGFKDLEWSRILMRDRMYHSR